MLEQLPISSQTLLHPVRRFNLGTGDTAIENTLKLMAQIIRESEKNYYVRRFAEHITEESPKDDQIRIKAIYDFIRAHTVYMRDPMGFEFIKTPLVSLQQIESGARPTLDCDDYTVLSLSLLRTLGFPVAMRAASYKQGGGFSHVYGLIKTKQGYQSMDCTREFGFGWEAPNAARKMDYIIK